MSIIHDGRDIVISIEVYLYLVVKVRRHVAQLVTLLCTLSQFYASNLSLSVQVKAHLSRTTATPCRLRHATAGLRRACADMYLFQALSAGIQ